MLQIVDYYQVLQVDPTAHPDVVRAAYRVLARLNHPDIAGGDRARMAALNQARSVLEDPQTRSAYDRSRAVMTSPAHRPDAVPATRGGSSPGKGGTVLDFSRYSGWTIEQIARTDPDFLEWLVRMPIGLRHRNEIEMTLAARRTAVMQATPAKPARR
jgi:curved DNA-binding protein CbpA